MPTQELGLCKCGLEAVLDDNGQCDLCNGTCIEEGPGTADHPINLVGAQSDEITAAAVALFQSVERVNGGVWQVPHASMVRLMAALTAAGVEF
jgi:hypothetical protein